MGASNWVVLVSVALLSGGVTPFLVALLKRSPEVRQLDAQTGAITIAGAETTVALTVRALERAEAREASLEKRLIEREAKIDQLESRLDKLSAQLHTATLSLEEARRQLSAIRT